MRLAIVVMFAACGAVASATSFIPTDVSELAREARAIARGRVVAVEPRWSDDRRRIDTLVTLETERFLKGGLGSTVQFVVPGGRLGRYRSIVVGAPRFEPGERVIVFLAGSVPSLPHVIGLSQGLFRVVQETDGWKVTPPPVLAGGDTRIVRGDPARRPMALDVFERQVHELVENSR